MRSFSKHFITIQSRSPRSSVPSFFRSTLRSRAVRVPVSPSDEILVLGLCGSTSRIVRIISAKPFAIRSLMSNGVVPVSSSYSSTPRL